jgi:alpha-1,2-mannosyltransferase
MEKLWSFFSRARWILIGVLVLAVGFRAVSQAAFFRTEMTDLTVYLAAAKALREGRDPYSIITSRGWHFISPIASAVLFVPLTQMAVGLASAIWYILNIAFLVGTILLALDLLVAHDRVIVQRRIWGIPLLLLSGPIIVTLSRGQWSLLLGFLLTLGWWCYLTKRDFSCGFYFGLAATLKLLPLIFGVYLVAKRRWIPLGGFIVALAVGGVLMPGIFVKWARIPTLYREWAQLVVSPSLMGERSQLYDPLLSPILKRNQSISAVMSRLFVGATLTERRDSRLLVQKTATLLADVFLIVGAAIVLSRKRAARIATIEAAEVGLVSCLMLFLSPVSWSHYYTVLLLPLLLLTGAAMRLVAAPFSSRAATRVLAAIFAIVVIHEISATAQVYGAFLAAGMIVFGSCWYWLWRSRPDSALST